MPNTSFSHSPAVAISSGCRSHIQIRNTQSHPRCGNVFWASTYLGLAEGLNAIHIQSPRGIKGQKPSTGDTTPGIMPKITVAGPAGVGHDDESAVHQGLLFGRHGDIKPQNILCFAQAARRDPASVPAVGLS